MLQASEPLGEAGGHVKKYLFASTAVLLSIGGGWANAGDIAVPPAPLPAPPYSWTGFYGGVTAGAAWGQYNARTSTAGGSYLDAASAAAVDAAGAQSVKPTGFTTGIEGGYNWQTGSLLLGIEADIQALHLNGATNSGAVAYPGAPGGSFTITSYGNADWLFTARPRIGFVTPGHWLIYATGGLALTALRSDFSFVDSGPAEESGKLDAVKAGYAVGGGVEAPLTERLSVKAEYLYVDFANAAAAITNPPAGQTFTQSSDLTANIVRAGLNYRFGGPDAPLAEPIMPLKAPAWKPPLFTDWEVEVGARLSLSNGVDGEGPLFSNGTPNALLSRLIYSGLDALSGETFARVDHASGFFAKGYLGAGGIDNGHLNDEDFPAKLVYSNTSHDVSGHIGYATIDAGYNFIRVPGAKLGAFVGYNYYNQVINTYGCTQLAGDTPCSAPSPPTLGLTENDHFNSLRVGLSSVAMLTDRLRLTADAAYLPWVDYSGLDDHLARQLLGPDAADSGNGVMLEAVLDYYITDAWAVGVGGRYWAWNMNTGTAGFNDLVTPAENTVQPSRYSTERYGAFVQTSYRWGDVTPGAAPNGIPVKVPVLAAGPMDWTGVYVGGHLGGGYSDDHWSDPFGSTVGRGGFDNVAGFGDTTHGTGPLGGGQIGANWQLGQIVLGVEADGSGAELRGENTCFSGIGGINCQHTVDALGTITGRIGFAWGRSLAYVKGGGAWTDTNYQLLGNTGALSLGTGSTTLDVWGWTVGGGIEYALTNHWTALVEYDHIGLPATVVAFPTVTTINAATISVRQTVDLFRLGVNYKFNLASLAVIAARD